MHISVDTDKDSPQTLREAAKLILALADARTSSGASAPVIAEMPKAAAQPEQATHGEQRAPQPAQNPPEEKLVPRGMPNQAWRSQPTPSFQTKSQSQSQTSSQVQSSSQPFEPRASAPAASAQPTPAPRATPSNAERGHTSSQELLDEENVYDVEEEDEKHIERVPVIAVEDLTELVDDEDAPGSASVQLGRRERHTDSGKERRTRDDDDSDASDSVMPRLPPGVKVY